MFEQFECAKCISRANVQNIHLIWCKNNPYVFLALLEEKGEGEVSLPFRVKIYLSLKNIIVCVIILIWFLVFDLGKNMRGMREQFI